MSCLKSVLLLIVISFVLGSQLNSQAAKSQREVGFNMTQLLDVIIPFKEGSTFPGPFAIIWRQGKNERFFNFQMGASTNSTSDDGFLNAQVGYLRKHIINEKVKYYTSKNIIASVGSTILEQSQFDDDLLLGLSIAGGFEYSFSENFSVVSETTFAIFFTGEGGFTFIPPVGVYLLGRF